MRKRASSFTPPRTPRKTSRMATSSTASAVVKRGGTTVRQRAGRQLARSLAIRRGLSRLNPYIGAAMTAYPYAKSGYQFVRGLLSKKKGRGKGASQTKSSGWFKSFKKQRNSMERYLNTGVVRNMEQGDVLQSTNQVNYLAHSTCPKIQTLNSCLGGLLKHLFKKAGIKIKNWSEPILEGANIPARIEIKYKEADGSVVSTQAFTIPVTKTLDQIVFDMSGWIIGFTGVNFPSIFLSMQYYHDIGTIGSSRLIAYDIDLTSTVFHIHAKSHMKIQNRTVNTAANDQSDDIDNVPVYGRHFLVRGNGTVYRDYDTPATASFPQLRTDATYGVLNYTTPNPNTGSTLLNEVPLKNQLTGCMSYGPAHLDPGQVKTSKLSFTKRISFNKFILLFKAKATGGATGGINNNTPFYFGLTRIFGFEKMINAVAISTENAINLAYEHNLEIGCYVKTYQNNQTAKILLSNIGKVTP